MRGKLMLTFGTPNPMTLNQMIEEERKYYGSALTDDDVVHPTLGQLKASYHRLILRVIDELKLERFNKKVIDTLGTEGDYWRGFNSAVRKQDRKITRLEI